MIVADGKVERLRVRRRHEARCGEIVRNSCDALSTTVHILLSKLSVGDALVSRLFATDASVTGEPAHSLRDPDFRALQIDGALH